MILVPYTHESNINNDIEIFHLYFFHLTQINHFCSFSASWIGEDSWQTSFV